MTTPDFTVSDKFNRDKAFTQVKFGANTKVLEVELNEMQKIMAEARASLVREQVHSGVVDYLSSISSGYSSASVLNGQIQVDTSYWATRGAENSLVLTPTNLLVNGYKLLLKGFKNLSPSGYNDEVLNLIGLASPPVFGSRDDLVFLEAWFEEIDYTDTIDKYGGESSGTIANDLRDPRYNVETTRRIQLRWRIRTVAGVDFSLFTEGLGRGNTTVGVQGANATPLIYTGNDLWNHVYRQATDPNLVFSNDKGLYVAGNGDQTSKDTLKTADGYVYAIPLFRVKRRNNAGYREDNLNGARDYQKAYISFPNESANADTEVTITLNADLPFTATKGDLIYHTNGSLLYTVEEVIPPRTIKALKNTQYMEYEGYLTTGNSGRPDGLYSNIIDASDIIDLRHRVSLTGLNYQMEMEKAFDQLLRGELQTKDSEQMVKNRYGLTKAPLGLAQELVPQTVVGDDGVPRDLVNVLGAQGLQQSNLIQNTKLTSSTSVKSGEYYLLIGSAYTTNTIDKRLSLETYNGATLGNASLVDMPSSYAPIFTTLAVTVDADSLVLRNIALGAYYQNMALYKIDQATYNNIQNKVTGFDNVANLANKFPYISSYPNLVENLLPSLSDSKWSLTGTGVVKVSDYEYTCANVGSQWNVGGTINVPIKPSTTYNLSCVDSDNCVVDIHFKDGTGTDISAISSAPTNKQFTTPSNAVSLAFVFKNSELNTMTSLKGFLLSEWVKIAFVPYGRWYLPNDYANSKSLTKVTEAFDKHRKTFSDAQTSETILDIVEALRTPQKHITVTQATEGTWAVNDTIKVKSDYGVISGVIDSDTALATIIKADGTSSLTLNAVSSLSVNDTFIAVKSDGTLSAVHTVLSIDSTNKIITTDAGYFQSDWDGAFIVETTASTSSPVATATGLVGNWTGLGTKEATFTITTAPTTATDKIVIQYSVNYPAGKGIEYVPSQVLEAKVNGERLISGTTLSVKGDFNGKVSGSTDLIPHVSKWNKGSGDALNTALLNPTNPVFLEFAGSGIFTLDGLLEYSTQTQSGGIAQTLFSFNLIRLVEDKYGEIPSSDKVQWLKDNVSKLTVNWWGYGNSPSGNKADFRLWREYDASWQGTAETTNSTPTMLQIVTTVAPNYIDSNGFANLLAYANASDGVTASTIYTDYVDIEVELNVAETGYTVLQPENTMPVLSENLLTQNQAFPVDLSGVYGHNMSVAILDNGIIESTISAVNDSYLAIASGDNKKVNGGEYVTMSFQARTKNGDSATAYIRLIETGGSDVRGDIYDIDGEWKTVYGSIKMDSSATAVEPRVQLSSATTYQLRNFKLEKGANPNPVWSAGRKKKVTLNYLGKVAGSTFENPNKMSWVLDSAFISEPQTVAIGNETLPQGYTQLEKQDGSLNGAITSTSGQYSQQLYEFDLSHLGLSLSELKSALRKLTVSWTGYGVGDNAGVLTYGATASVWINGAWVVASGLVNTASIPTTGSWVNTYPSNNLGVEITNDQKFYVLVHSTYPAGTSSDSEIYTDYIKLDVELADYVDYKKTNIVKVSPATKEVKLHFPAKSYRYVGGGNNEDKVEVWYKTIPYQGTALASSLNLGLNLGSDNSCMSMSYFITTIGTGGFNKGNALNSTAGQISAEGLEMLPLKDDVGYNLIGDNLIIDGITRDAFVKGGRDLVIRSWYDSLDSYNLAIIGWNSSAVVKQERGYWENGQEGADIIVTKVPDKGNYVVGRYGIISINNELFLFVHTNYNTDKMWENAVKDLFKIQGRPLIKGVS